MAHTGDEIRALIASESDVRRDAYVTVTGTEPDDAIS